MTHSYEDIIRLDSERTQGEFVLEQWPMAEPKPAGILTRDKQLICEFCSRTKMIDAQYIAAMPDAVGLLEELQEAYDDPRGDIMWRAGIARAMGIIKSKLTYSAQSGEGE